MPVATLDPFPLPPLIAALDDDSPIRLTHQDPRWRQEFEQTRSGVLQSCEGRVTQIEHIGGTALPGCISRPVIDLIAGSLDPVELDEAADRIEGLYFRRLPAPEWAGDAIRLVKPRGGEATHQLFLMPIGCAAWNQSIRLRDAFRSSPEKLVRFEESKVALWKRCEGRPADYESGKRLVFAHFIDQLGIGTED